MGGVTCRWLCGQRRDDSDDLTRAAMRVQSKREIMSTIMCSLSKSADNPPSNAAAAAHRAATALRCAASVDCLNMATVHAHNCARGSPELWPPMVSGCTMLALAQ